jgi:hypothetical protein
MGSLSDKAVIQPGGADDEWPSPHEIHRNSRHPALHASVVTFEMMLAQLFCGFCLALSVG